MAKTAKQKINNVQRMQEISEQKLLEALNSEEGRWQELPFPEDKIPTGHRVRSVQGQVGVVTFISVQFVTPHGHTGYDGTFIMPPVMGHSPEPVSRAAFLKGQAWLEKQKTKA
jgi:hypothetical protein